MSIIIITDDRLRPNIFINNAFMYSVYYNIEYVAIVYKLFIVIMYFNFFCIGLSIHLWDPGHLWYKVH